MWWSTWISQWKYFTFNITCIPIKNCYSYDG